MATNFQQNTTPTALGELVIRADAAVDIGNGHVMRCLALAQGWQDRGGSVRFLCAVIPSSLTETLRAQGFALTPLPVAPGSFDDADAVTQNAAGSLWLVIDGDVFSPEYLRRLQAHPARTLLIDDYGARKDLAVDLVVNQNLNASPELYQTSNLSESQLLLGTEFLLLRREFRMRVRRAEFPVAARNILVTLGGTDPGNLSLRVVNACGSLASAGFHWTVATTSANPYLPTLKDHCGALPHVTVLVDASNMAEIMANADLAIIASGGTLWELLYLGCPVLSYSRNQAQARLVSQMASKGAIVDMGSAEAFDDAALASRIEQLAASPQERRSMSDAGARIVDGDGVNRVIDRLLQVGKASN